jgi:hypothetical protein
MWIILEIWASTKRPTNHRQVNQSSTSTNTTHNKPQVVMSAQWNVEHHLSKLSIEGKAAASALGLWAATPQAALPPREG